MGRAKSERNANDEGRVVVGHFAMRVRGFLRRFERGFFTLSAAEGLMQLKSRQAADFINHMVALELVEPAMPFSDKGAFQVATRGHASRMNRCEANFSEDSRWS